MSGQGAGLVSTVIVGNVTRAEPGMGSLQTWRAALLDSRVWRKMWYNCFVHKAWMLLSVKDCVDNSPGKNQLSTQSFIMHGEDRKPAKYLFY